MDGLVDWHLGANGFELGFLLVARDRDMTSLIGGDALLQGSIVQITAAPQHFPQRLLLGRRGTQFLFVSLVYDMVVHSDVFRLIDRKLARARAAEQAFPSRGRMPNGLQRAIF